LDALSMSGDEATAVRGVFSWSYRALPDDAARTFRLLSLYPGLEPSVPATAAIVGTTLAATRRLLDSLAAVHLVEESVARATDCTSWFGSTRPNARTTRTPTARRTTRCAG